MVHAEFSKFSWHIIESCLNLLLLFVRMFSISPSDYSQDVWFAGSHHTQNGNFCTAPWFANFLFSAFISPLAGSMKCLLVSSNLWEVFLLLFFSPTTRGFIFLGLSLELAFSGISFHCAIFFDFCFLKWFFSASVVFISFDLIFIVVS